jgi:hypothetical protein
VQIDVSRYLDTDARIIAEDDTHAVIALRVRKSVISRNLALLAALGDLAACPSDCQLTAGSAGPGR